MSAGKLGDGTAFPGAASGDLYYNCFIVTYKLSEKWTYIFEHDLGINYNVNPRDGRRQPVVRVEQLSDLQDQRLLVVGRTVRVVPGPARRPRVGRQPRQLLRLDGGVNYKPHANITIRPELRYDWFDSFAGTTAQPFNNGTPVTALRRIRRDLHVLSASQISVACRVPCLTLVVGMFSQKITAWPRKCGHGTRVANEYGGSGRGTTNHLSGRLWRPVVLGMPQSRFVRGPTIALAAGSRPTCSSAQNFA